MKLKYILLYGLLGAAFLGVSLWVILSGGKNARAIRAKYSLGGKMLAVWSLISFATFSSTGCTISCYDPGPTCYDAAPPSLIIGKRVFNSGDEIALEISFDVSDFDHLELEIFYHGLDSENRSVREYIQNATLTLEGENIYVMTVTNTDYHGPAFISIIGISKEDNKEVELYCDNITLNEDRETNS